jgi:hypothetical protein
MPEEGRDTVGKWLIFRSKQSLEKDGTLDF